MDLHDIMILYRNRKLLSGLLMTGIIISLSACSDAFEVYGPEGEKTVVSLLLHTPEMAVRTRADMDAKQACLVNNVWVGIYDAKTGQRKTHLIVEKNETPDEHDPKMLVERIETTSGMSHIAAVANIDNIFGVSTDKPDASLRTVRELLDEADTWEKYRTVSIMQTQSGNVNTPIGALSMSGMYYEQKKEDASDWVEASNMPFYIPAGKNITLPGAVHLRRLMSQMRFNVIEGENIVVTPISWQVHNTPNITYLREQVTNATDDMENSGEGVYYAASGLFHSFEKAKATLANGTVKDCMTFDFWQFDNKHTGLDKTNLGESDYFGVEEYADREREWKADADDNKKTNTGVYKSLCPTSEGDANNKATYVELKAKVEYNVMITQNADGTEVEKVVPAGTTGSVHRIGYSTYTVHLGYCEGSDDVEKSKDFNCRRNTKYTYNLTIEGLNKIKVEAMTDGEPQPGTDGDITDIEEKNIMELDAHYNTFNITLTNKQRKDMKWLIRTPFGNDALGQTIFSEDYKTGGIHAGQKLDDNQFYTWIRFKPTTDANTLRVYKDKGANSDLMTLQDLADPVNHPGIRKRNTGYVNYSTIDDTPLYYTVFVDEYVYEKDLEGKNLPLNGWYNYVNKNPRMVWLVIDKLNTSTDKESMYIKSDYMIMQKSIMTFYNSQASTAIGIEHKNETFGYNLGWSKTAHDNLSSSVNEVNGRYNVWTYLTNAKVAWNDIAKTGTANINGTSVTTTQVCHRDPVSSVQYPLAGEAEEPKGGVTEPLYALKSFTSSSRWPSDKNLNYNPFPSSGELYDIVTACMNRNRDENGDGKIDMSELKWYVPTYNRYVQMVLGRNSIPEPLMDFSITPVYNGNTANGNNSDYNTRFHFTSSDMKNIWAEEGTSSSTWDNGGWERGAWQVRCVRNLGASLSTVQTTDPIDIAYTWKEADRTFEMKYYNTEVLRAGIRGNLGEHDVASFLNQPAYMFEYAKEDCSATNTDATLFSGTSLNSGNDIDKWIEYVNDNSVCGKYSQEADGSDKGTWRVPNQKELIMMMRANLFKNGSGYWASCTREHYDMAAAGGKRRFFVSLPNGMTINSDGAGARHVRCVRDVIK